MKNQPARLSEIVEWVSNTGEPVTIFKRNKPTVSIVPLVGREKTLDSITNKETLQAIENVETMTARTDHQGFSSVVDFFDALYGDESV